MSQQMPDAWTQREGGERVRWERDSEGNLLGPPGVPVVYVDLTAPTLTVTDFVLARIAEEEWVANTASGTVSGPAQYGHHLWNFGDQRLEITRARVLAQCAAMREIVECHQEILTVCQGCATARYPCRTLRALASIWSDHPDWREEWRA
ncbi:MAG: DUF6221 family protein [Mycobacteriaceae bacterium]